MHNRTVYNKIIVFEIQLDKIKQCLQQRSVKSMQKLTNLRGVNLIQNSSYKSNLTFHLPISIIVKTL